MAARKCPYCLTSISPFELVTNSYNLVCRGCQRPLEISRISRNLAIFVGLIAGAVIWYWARNGADVHQAIGWVLPTLYSLIVFGVISALMLMATGDLSLKADEDVQHHVHAEERHSTAADSHGGHGTH
jgi:hypothetical protein